jgi:hypothetical protein
MVNAFLAWENEVGKEVYESDEGMPIGSRVTRFFVRVIDAILPSL